jgi:4,5-DOPA dioxygenase extradiol
MKASDLGKMVAHLAPTDKMPVLFIGHGSPMNAIEENEFVDGFRRVGETLPKPHAIICISAHWQTEGTMVTAMPKPRTIHDFGGFPRSLYEVEYPAPGDPDLALEAQRMISGASIGLDYEWGLDHCA